MIKTRDDLKNYIEKDKSRYHSGFLVKNPYLKYLICLRKAEFYCNNRKLLRFYYVRKLNKMKLKTQIDLGINIAGCGLFLPHGKVVVSEYAHIGNNCTLYSDVTIGVNGKTSGGAITGNNVIIGTGARIIGALEIADDVYVGANAVVLTNIRESGVTVVGIPARIIHAKEI